MVPLRSGKGLKRTLSQTDVLARQLKAQARVNDGLGRKDDQSSRKPLLYVAICEK
jgi:hypothetical protein